MCHWDDEDVSMKNDIGLICSQPPAAVANVFSTAVARLEMYRSDFSMHNLSSHILNVVIIFHVFCISLYDDVDQLSRNSTDCDWKKAFKMISQPPEM